MVIVGAIFVEEVCAPPVADSGCEGISLGWRREGIGGGGRPPPFSFETMLNRN